MEIEVPKNALGEQKDALSERKKQELLWQSKEHKCLN
jgi:hypothetical protein